MTHTDTTTFSSDRYIPSKTVVFQAGIEGRRYTYTAREWDSESSTYYYRARYYAPSAARFGQRDPIEYAGGINLYSYVKSNPVNYADPLGMCPDVDNSAKGYVEYHLCAITLGKDKDEKEELCPPGTERAGLPPVSFGACLHQNFNARAKESKVTAPCIAAIDSCFVICYLGPTPPCLGCAVGAGILCIPAAYVFGQAIRWCRSKWGRCNPSSTSTEFP